MERKDIPENLRWKTADIFPNDEAWEQEYKKVEAEYADYDFSVFKGKLSDKDTLLKCFKLTDTVSRRLEKLYLYAHLTHDQDVRVSKYTSANAMVGALISKIFAEFSFVEPELTKLDDDVLQAFIADPDFAEYDYRLKKIADSKAHVLSEAEEKLLTLGGDVMREFRGVFSMLNNANLNLPKAKYQGEEVQMSHGMYGVVLHTGTAEERKEWFEKYYQAFINLIDAITQTYYANVKQDVFYKTVRKYDSCLQKALDGEDVSLAIRENAVSMAASHVSAHPAVRAKMVELQRQIAAKMSCVLDGRDIGTVVLPKANFKFFITADSKVRAQRRYEELLARGQKVDFDQLHAEIVQRDKQDSERATAPLKAADDAIIVDTSNLTIEEVVHTIKSYIQSKV